jgi:hypothetical protein
MSAPVERAGRRRTFEACQSEAFGSKLGLPLRLYWCFTDDHDEDWFVVARRRRTARRFFAGYEGYDVETVEARRILTLPVTLQRPDSFGWPTRELLEGCGAVIERWDTPRVIGVRGHRYVEGMLEHQILQVNDDHFEYQGKGRPNRTTRTEVS